MTIFTFETMTAADASGFTSADFLLFQNASSNASTVTVSPTISSTGTLTNSSLTITDASGKSLAFGAQALSLASLGAATNGTGQIVFSNNDKLLLGLSDTQTAAPSVTETGGATPTLNAGAQANDSIVGSTGNDVVYGFEGNDTLNGSTGNDYVYGGNGADSIIGLDGNDHLFGNVGGAGGGADTGTQVIGAVTINDYIDGGSGADYINGNAGNDSILGGVGSDRIFGGNGNDIITGDDGNDTINGNLGNDTIDGGLNNDFIRGGQGNDVLTGAAGDDILKGDLGNDSLTGGTGVDVLEGGAGNDSFTFAAGDASITFTTSSQGVITYTGGATTVVTDLISDYADGADSIKLGFAVTAVLKASGAVFTTMAAAQTQAQQLLTSANTLGDIAAIAVGSDTYLFYNDAGTAAGTINAAIKVLGVDAAVFSQSGSPDFIFP